MKLIVYVIVALLFVPAASGAKPLPGANEPFAFHFKNRGEDSLSHRVDQQSPNWPNTDSSTWVVNPLWESCDWDVDDTVEYAGYGRVLEPGSVATQSNCLIADGGDFAGSVVGHLYFINLTAPSPNLLVSVLVGADRVTAVPVQANGVWSYRACVVPSIDSSVTAVIPNSNGGIGAVRAVEWRVESQHPTRLRDVVASARLVVSNSLTRSQYC